MLRQQAKRNWFLSVAVFLFCTVSGIILRETTMIDPFWAYICIFLGFIPASIGSYQLSLAKRYSLAQAVRIKTKALSQELEKSERTKEAQLAFLAHMSHEFRTPLNAIMGFSATMSQEAFGPIDTPIYKEYADCIYKSGAHLLTIVNDILDFIKLETQQAKLKCDWINIQDVVNEAMQIITGYPNYDKRNIILADLSKCPRLYIDNRLIRQVLLNILSNAVKFTQDNGRIALKYTQTDKGEFVLSVSDNGIGIAPNQIPLVLRPFTQLENSMTRKYAGTGLGVPLSAQIMKLHNGELKIESVLKKGTTIHLVFPETSVEKNT
ncbi:MAG: HAMP domain-containing histidine kinase [Alphaproteobacteria bacterium]|nr:HAMP domain-containing histidine kinase [Alphaproteobacteria bacterium]